MVPSASDGELVGDGLHPQEERFDEVTLTICRERLIDIRCEAVVCWKWEGVSPVSRRAFSLTSWLRLYAGGVRQDLQIYLVTP
jgi:hypothetical protein